MSAFDVFTNFGTEIIEEVLNKGSAIIVAEPDEPAASIINLRKKKKMSQKQLAQKAELSLEQIRDAKDKNTRTSMFVLCKICLALDIDPKKISWQTFS
jgi:DNA-binding Xre family transcriptional regulator